MQISARPLVPSPFLDHHCAMPVDSPLTLDDLRTFEAQVQQHLANGGQTVPFLKDGMLAVIRTAIAAMEELERLTPARVR